MLQSVSITGLFILLALIVFIIWLVRRIISK